VSARSLSLPLPLPLLRDPRSIAFPRTRCAPERRPRAVSRYLGHSSLLPGYFSWKKCRRSIDCHARLYSVPVSFPARTLIAALVEFRRKVEEPARGMLVGRIFRGGRDFRWPSPGVSSCKMLPASTTRDGFRLHRLVYYQRGGWRVAEMLELCASMRRENDPARRAASGAAECAPLPPPRRKDRSRGGGGGGFQSSRRAIRALSGEPA